MQCGQSAADFRQFVEIQLSADDLLSALRCAGEYLAPGVNNHAVPVGRYSSPSYSRLSGCHYKALILDGARPYKGFPMGLSGGGGE